MGVSTDVHLAWRTIRRRPLLAAAVVLPIALAIAVNSALFSVMDGLLFRPLPFERPEELVAIDWRRAGQSLPEIAWAPWMKAEREQFCAAVGRSLLLAGAAQAGRASALSGARELGLQVTGIDARFFRLLGLTPLLGADFTADDERSRGSALPRPVIIDHGLWQRQFGGDPAVLGVHDLAGERVRIVGVMGPGVKFPDETNVWFPVPSDRAFLPAYARLAPGATVAQLAAAFPLVEVTPLADAVRPDGGRTLVVLFGVACLLLLVAWVQVAALVFAGTVGRLNEIGVRLALGGGRLRLVREFAVENAVLAGAAFALAWLAARPLTAFVVSTLPAELSRGQYLEPDVRTFLFGCVASLAGFGLLTTLPVAVIRRASPLRLLQGHVGHLPLRAERVRHGLLVAQVTLTALLLYLSGLMVRSFVEAAQYDYGFDSEHVLLFTAPLPSVPPGTMPEFVPRCGGVPCDHAALSFEARFEEQQRRVFQSVDALHRTPGVLAAASLFDVPLVKPGLRRYSTEPGSPVLIGDQVRRFGGRPVVPPVPADVNAASANFVRALGARLAAGSSFDDPQHSGNEQIAVINESLARRLRPALGSADMWTPLLGQTLETRNEQGRVFRVVGVIRDLVYARPDEPPTPQIYFPVTSKAAGGVVAIRTTPSVEAASPAVRSVLQRMWGEDLSPKHFMLLRDAWHAGLLPFRGKALLVSLVGGFCVPLGAIGLIGALLYSVQVRTRETGIRIALGAEPAAVRRAVVLRALAIVTAGIVLGTACGVAAGRAVSHHLFNVHPADPSTIVGVASALLALAWCAALLPARRASRIDPAAALRHE